MRSVQLAQAVEEEVETHQLEKGSSCPLKYTVEQDCEEVSPSCAFMLISLKFLLPPLETSIVIINSVKKLAKPFMPLI